jgi:hypothetical protein
MKPGWLNELSSWITQQRIQAYHQYGVDIHDLLILNLLEESVMVIVS